MATGFFSSWEALLDTLRAASDAGDAGDASVIVKNMPQTFEHLHAHAAFRASVLLKKAPQEVLRNRPDYYMAYDPSTGTYYMCFKHLLMIDMDLEQYLKKGKTVAHVFQSLEQHPNECFDVYKSKNGYHIFCVSSPKNYADPDDLRIMWDLGCDYWYMAWASLRGWCVRLNMKAREFADWMVSDQETPCLYSYIGRYGQTQKTNKRLLHLVKVHLRWSRRFATRVSWSC